MYLVPLSRTVKYGDNNMFYVTFTTVKNVLFKKIKRAQRTERGRRFLFLVVDLSFALT